MSRCVDELLVALITRYGEDGTFWDENSQVKPAPSAQIFNEVDAEGLAPRQMGEGTR